MRNPDQGIQNSAYDWNLESTASLRSRLLEVRKKKRGARRRHAYFPRFRNQNCLGLHGTIDRSTSGFNKGDFRPIL